MKIERLRQIVIEPGLLPESVVRHRFAPGQCNRFQSRLKPFCFRNQIEPVTIRQTQVAQQHIHPHVFQQLQRVCHSTRRNHFMIRALEERRKDSTCILMIFNDKDVHALIGEFWALFLRNGFRQRRGCFYGLILPRSPTPNSSPLPERIDIQ